MLIEYNHPIPSGRIIEVASKERQGTVATEGSIKRHGLVHHLLVLAFADLDLALSGHLLGLGNDTGLGLVDFA